MEYKEFTEHNCAIGKAIRSDADDLVEKAMRLAGERGLDDADAHMIIVGVLTGAIRLECARLLMRKNVVTLRNEEADDG